LQRSFLQTYFEAFKRIEGWFPFDAALLFMAYHQFLAQRGMAGHVLEIGVHHGLSAIATASLRGTNKLFCAIDLFESLQEQNVSGSGSGDRRIFEQNMREFYPDPGFLRVIAGHSGDLKPQDLGSGFSFCRIDGGHTRLETYSDLCLCHELLVPGGLLALDDYFNAEYPGVCEGAVEFMLSHKNVLRPLAWGYQNLIFQKLPAPFDINAEFKKAFPSLETKTVEFWYAPALLVTSVLRSHVDLYASTPDRLVPLGEAGTRAKFSLAATEVQAASGQTVTLPVTVANTSNEVFPSGEKVLGLSYHLLSASGEVLRHDNERSWLTTPLQPGESRSVPLQVQAPSRPGVYQLELDLVWEQVMWFKEAGNPTARVRLAVS
jgi:predicted O-methyltransferase YrrM